MILLWLLLPKFWIEYFDSANTSTIEIVPRFFFTSFAIVQFSTADRPSFLFGFLQQRHIICIFFIRYFYLLLQICSFQSRVPIVFRVQPKNNVRTAYEYLLADEYVVISFAFRSSTIPHSMHRERAPRAHVKSVLNHIRSEYVSDCVL